MIRTNRKRRLVYPVTANDLTAIAIRETRQERDVTQQDLADALQVTRSHVANLETGRFNVSLALLWEIGEALDCEPRFLIPSIEELARENRNAKRRKSG